MRQMLYNIRMMGLRGWLRCELSNLFSPGPKIIGRPDTTTHDQRDQRERAPAGGTLRRLFAPSSARSKT